MKLILHSIKTNTDICLPLGSANDMLRSRWLRNLLGGKDRPLEIEKLLQVFMAPNGQSPNGSSFDSSFRSESKGQRNTGLQVRRPKTSVLRQMDLGFQLLPV